MDREREELYKRTATEIGNTPLYEIKHLEIANGNRIFAKEEYRNPTGSYYDRVFLNVLYSLEKDGAISPGQELVETTSGNAGASFAWLCAVLGYRATILMPGDMPHARIAQIRSFGAQLVFSPKGRYVSGVIEHLRQYLKERKFRSEAVYCTNHAESKAAIEGMATAGEEIIEQLPKAGASRLDVYFSALGGGINLRGVAPILERRWPNLRVVGVEPFEAPENYIKKFPGRFEATYGVPPTLGPHGLLGIGRWGDTTYRFPHIEAMLARIDDIILVRTEEWLEASQRLRDVEGQHIGRTSAACVWAALRLAREVEGKTFGLIFYDPAWKYLDAE